MEYSEPSWLSFDLLSQPNETINSPSNFKDVSFKTGLDSYPGVRSNLYDSSQKDIFGRSNLTMPNEQISEIGRPDPYSYGDYFCSDSSESSGSSSFLKTRPKSYHDTHPNPPGIPSTAYALTAKPQRVPSNTLSGARPKTGSFFDTFMPMGTENSKTVSTSHHKATIFAASRMLHADYRNQASKTPRGMRMGARLPLASKKTFSVENYKSLMEKYDQIDSLEESIIKECFEVVKEFNNYYKPLIIVCFINNSLINEEMKLSLNCLFVSINIISKYVEHHSPSIPISDSSLVCTFDGFFDFISSHHLAERICESILYTMCSLIKLSGKEVDKEFWKNKLVNCFKNDKISEENKLASSVILVQLDVSNNELRLQISEYLKKIIFDDRGEYFGFTKLEIDFARRNALKQAEKKLETELRDLGLRPWLQSDLYDSSQMEIPRRTILCKQKEKMSEIERPDVCKLSKEIRKMKEIIHAKKERLCELSSNITRSANDRNMIDQDSHIGIKREPTSTSWGHYLHQPLSIPFYDSSQMDIPRRTILCKQKKKMSEIERPGLGSYSGYYSGLRSNLYDSSQEDRFVTSNLIMPNEQISEIGRPGLDSYSGLRSNFYDSSQEGLFVTSNLTMPNKQMSEIGRPGQQWFDSYDSSQKNISGRSYQSNMNIFR